MLFAGGRLRFSKDQEDGVQDDSAAVIGALVPGAAIVILLPPSGWGLLAIVALDLAGALLLRRSISRRLHAPRPPV